MSTSSSPGLRERTRQAVRAELAAVAMRLFVRQGFDATTVGQIASEAGISRSSFFRYFATKEEVMLQALDEIGEQVAVALAARPEDEAPWVALRRSFDDISEQVEVQPDQARTLLRMLLDTPALHASHLHKRAMCTQAIADVLQARLPEPDDARRHLQAAALVSAALTSLELVQRTWAAADEPVSFTELLDTAMLAIAPL